MKFTLSSGSRAFGELRLCQIFYSKVFALINSWDVCFVQRREWVNNLLRICFHAQTRIEGRRKMQIWTTFYHFLPLFIEFYDASSVNLSVSLVCSRNDHESRKLKRALIALSTWWSAAKISTLKWLSQCKLSPRFVTNLQRTFHWNWSLFLVNFSSSSSDKTLIYLCTNVTVVIISSFILERNGEVKLFAVI